MIKVSDFLKFIEDNNIDHDTPIFIPDNERYGTNRLCSGERVAFLETITAENYSIPFYSTSVPCIYLQPEDRA